MGVATNDRLDTALTPRGAIPGAYTLLIAQELGLGVGQLEELLVDVGLSETEVRREDALLSAEQQVTVLTNALALTDDDDFGFRLGRRLTIASHGPLGFLISTSRDLSDALQVAAAYAPTRVSFLSLALSEAPGHIALTCTFDVDASAAVHQCMAQALSLVVMDLAGFILGRPAREIEVDLPYPDPGSPLEALPGPQRFACEVLTLRVPDAISTAPNASANHALHEVARAQCEAVLADLPRDDSMRSQLERVLLASASGMASEEDAAAVLFVSARTLARRLGEEGTTFREVREHLLARLAARHLRDGVPVASIAKLLGYHDASGFRRAFKRWYGVTPDCWRRES